jgi:hypothetical protein
MLASLLSGSQAYNAYVIRHPFPPYATHYAVLLGLTRFVSFDLAEKLLICIIFVCTAYGVRYCARSLGPSGDLLSLCMIPWLLHWSLVMGFLNYSLAVGLFFLAAGLWCRAAAGQVRLWLFFAMVSFLLALTHPIPLLLLIVFCSLDLLIRLIQGDRRVASRSRITAGNFLGWRSRRQFSLPAGQRRSVAFGFKPSRRSGCTKTP